MVVVLHADDASRGAIDVIALDVLVEREERVEMEAHGARMTLAAISKGLRIDLGILERLEGLNASRLEASNVAETD